MIDIPEIGGVYCMISICEFSGSDGAVLVLAQGQLAAPSIDMRNDMEEARSSRRRMKD